MNILFLTMANFSGVNEHSIYPDLIRCLAGHGHSVYVLLPNEARNNQETFIENVGNVHIVRVKTGNLFNVGMIIKLISRAGLARKYKFALKKYLNGIDFELILYSTPPTIFYRIVSFIKKKNDTYAYLMLKDIFPQNAVDLGIISQKGLLFKFLRIGEKKLYKVSDTIGCMSPANVKFLLKQDPWIEKGCVEVCPNALEPLVYNFPSKENVRMKYDIPLDKIVFVYGGGLGKPQGIYFLISCIEKMPEDSDCFYLICGDGPFYKELKELEYKYPEKMKLIKWLPVDEYNAIVNSSDIGLVFLDYNFQIPNFPSRILLYMECGLPILAATDKSSDIGKISNDNGFGDWCESKPGNEDEFIDKMLGFKELNRRKIMGEKSRKYFEENYTVENVYKTIMSHFRF